MFTDGLSGKYDYVSKEQPELKKRQLSLSYGPLEVCQLFKEEYYEKG